MAWLGRESDQTRTPEPQRKSETERVGHAWSQLAATSSRLGICPFARTMLRELRVTSTTANRFSAQDSISFAGLKAQACGKSGQRADRPEPSSIG